MTTQPVVLGIDPGRSGGLALVGDNLLRTWKMPETERDILDVMAEAKSLGASVAVLELVRSSPQMGVASAFTFGSGYGGLRMAVIASGLRLEEVTPPKWQGALRCRSGGDKNVTKRRAQEAFPGVKVTHAIADALLLAEWGRRTLGAAPGPVVETGEVRP